MRRKTARVRAQPMYQCRRSLCLSLTPHHLLNLALHVAAGRLALRHRHIR